MPKQVIVIEIREDSRKLVAEFNNGVAPEVNYVNPEFFVLYPDGDVAIISGDQLNSEFFELAGSYCLTAHVKF